MLLLFAAGLASPSCEDTCPGNPQWIADGSCNDGGVGSEYSDCAFGTDCTDCGDRTAAACSTVGVFGLTVNSDGPVRTFNGLYEYQGD